MCQAWAGQAVLPCPTALPGRSGAMQAQCTAAHGFQGPQSRREPAGDHADCLLGRSARFANLDEFARAIMHCTALDMAIRAPDSNACSCIYHTT